ncbi:MAG: helix-turn-helix domain-containing protein [Actinophytocola sp.]|uniref:ArsR/SmtB family transcription factor n=1 Tax=Actinophytocola sp. TaxID=1872138 RepID=UPI001329B806|nr:helix-turn-helix domain-containing protein [Actinophytocola sp.]MPZ81049.1 helix-turn-helix domain-containing protein [Actinophytocola sp.]
MITLRMTAGGMARTRLALSPVAEVTVWLWLLVLGRRHPLFGDVGPVARSVLCHRDVALVASTLSRGYAPDLLTPAPTLGRALSVLDDQLDKISGAAQEAIAEQVGHIACYSGQVATTVRDAVDAGTFGRRAANGLRVFWRHVLADGWGSLQDSMEADLAGRTRTMADHGLSALLGSLHPDIRWTGESLRIALGGHEENVTLGTRELVLSPSVLNWPNVALQVCGKDSAVINYPATGLVANRRRDPGVLARLYGDTRAGLLADLDRACSTAELSVRHDIAPSTVSYHLRVLHQAGLVIRRREGHYVLYQRNPS